MKMRIPITLLFGGCLFTACERDFSTSIADHPPLPPELRDLKNIMIAAGNQFGFDLFQEMTQTDKNANLFISPFSVSMALGMTLNGAAGQTETDMRRTLGLANMSGESINTIYRNLIDELAHQDEQVLFEIANSIWTRLNFPVLDSFMEVNRTFFDAEARELDFSLPEAKDIINGWITNKTHGKIEETIDHIDPAVVMYLINAIYFKAAWTYEFDPEKTIDADFHAPLGDVKCRMMNMGSRLMYFESKDFQSVDLGYGEGKFSMSLFLPKTGKSMDDLIAQFTSENWNKWIGLYDSTEIVLGLPKFKAEYKTLLNKPLTALGMGIAFGGAADFSGINPDRDLFISRVIHQTFVEVNEEGTEAAAVTVVEIRETSAGPQPVSMRIDRPFLFVIRDHDTGAILFMGKITNPTHS